MLREKSLHKTKESLKTSTNNRQILGEGVEFLKGGLSLQRVKTKEVQIC